MTEYRPFRNTDPPALAEVWRSQPEHGGLMQPMSMAVLERYVLSKPTFDRQGLIVATAAGRVVGFAHAGFGPSADERTLSPEQGVVSLVMCRPDADEAVGCELVNRCEAYLRQRGAKVLWGGGRYPLTPFYYGLYGGSEFSGILSRDTRARAVFAGRAYREACQSLVMRRELAGFRPTVDRRQMQIRRQTTLEVRVDPPTATWWEAVVYEPFERTRAFLLPRDGSPPTASVHFWNMETMTGTLGLHAVGIVGTQVSGSERRQGLARYLLGESLRQLLAQGVHLAEVHVPAENPGAIGLFAGLGFAEVDRTIVYCKD